MWVAKSRPRKKAAHTSGKQKKLYRHEENLGFMKGKLVIME